MTWNGGRPGRWAGDDRGAKEREMPTGASLKQRIRDGAIIVALRAPITIGRQALEAALAKGSYDLIYIDGQHTAFSDDQLVTICALAEELGLPVQFRIPHTRQTHLIGRYLDLGPAAILVPEVEETAVVDEAIAYSYYSPVGRRSWGGAARHGARARGGRLDRREYAEWWNDTVVLSVQLESTRAIDNARALVPPGVYYLAFGPNVLSFDLEARPEYPLRTVDDCMRHVAEQVAGSGVRLGMAVVTEPEERSRYLDMGVTLFQEAPRP
jgi:2-keto-3-deoxy-L-rhamnonate aldolase RhmA